jgi:hypothetical protein
MNDGIVLGQRRFVPDRWTPAWGLGRGLWSTAVRSGRIGALALAMALALEGQSTPVDRGAADPIPGEFELKAAFVLNFIRLVNWASVPEENGAELPVCALANSEFAEAVRQAVAGKTVASRSISFRLTASPDPAHCRVLIVDAAQYRVARPALNAVKDAPVLTIGDGRGLASLGGMFELVVQDRKVQFDASLDAIRRARLDVSARLLQLSRNLRKGANGAF